MITKFHLFERSKNSLFESKNDIRTFYHATKPKYLPSIVKHGLTPNLDRDTNWHGALGKWSKGKVFVTADIFTAQFYGEQINHFNDNFHPILRIKLDKNELIKDDETDNDWYSTKPIIGNFEVRDIDKTWKKLTPEVAQNILDGYWDEPNPMKEGLTVTVPNKKVVKILKRKFPDYYTSILSDGEIEISAGRKEYVEDIKSIDDVCKIIGWFISHGTVGGSYFKYSEEGFFEHKFDEIILKPIFDLKDVPGQPSIMYHVTPKRNIERINKTGLVPKHKDKTSYHPDRIYLTDELEFAWGLKKQFERKYKLEYDILKVNMKGLDIKLYSDVDARTYGFYTLENIPPKNISILPKEEYRKHWKGVQDI